MELIEKAKKAKKASAILSATTTEEKNAALNTIADELINHKDFILSKNELDIQNGKETGLSSALIDRLTLTEKRINDIAEGLNQVAKLKDPVGEKIESWERPNGLQITSVRVPLGVVGMIYEARPNVTVDAAGLCLKTGNAVILRGSSSAIESNKALVTIIHQALEKTALPADAVQLIEDTSREAASAMFKLNDYLDVLIPRGGAGLIKTVVNNSTVPVLETGAGNCHVYIDESAEKQMAIDIAVNAKTQRPSVCNAIETLLIHKRWADAHLGDVVKDLQTNGVACLGDDYVVQHATDVKKATEEDWATEFLDNTIAIKVVNDVEEAIEHINDYGTKHSEAIVSENEGNVKRFFQAVDAAALYHNASTRFTDGFEFGFGAEIGISTQKLHARGPMGLKALTTNKYVIEGTGQIRE
ncbi:glutamate-5-semialdehyde dehydrogenase [Pueribacillus theae]|uniref:Gamma-glutamyl phosphate reductase n=1 Tax=Pueribacillus theae TaxID=2171751 RepID=A0A2U1K8A9_9BACI|nr:glutamate-5-semialdehyde dehydrogenase [Pueribacillus theae]PWA13268.1 glutamate-5-semialdehyde dehydrogenase [Pueribacillus theae]